MRTRPLSIFVLAMMNVAIVMDIRGLTIIAQEGTTMFFYLAFATFCVLLPISLISGELASGWPKRGGVYSWVKEAFGPRWGFLAIWLQWTENMVWFPTVLAFAASAFAYFLMSPELAQNNYFIITVVLVIYWAATLLSCRGIHLAGSLTTIGVIAGTIAPSIFLIALGFYWWGSGNEIQFLMNKPLQYIPDFTNFNKIAFLASIALLYVGIEANAVHVLRLSHPRIHFCYALFLSVVIIVAVFALGSLTLAAVLPADQISLSAGLLQTFSVLLDKFNLSWLLPIVSLLMVFGVSSSVIAWINAPSRGLLATAQDGNLPPFFKGVNKHGVQTRILYIQGAVVTFLSLTFAIIPNVADAFFILTDLTAILYLIMYALFFLAAIRLRYSHPDIDRRFKIPGGNVGMWIVSGVGFISVCFAIIVGFFPPVQIKLMTPTFYVSFLLIGVLIFAGAPWVIELFRNPSWKADPE